MNESDEYRRNADYCRYMADSPRKEDEKRAWLGLAQSWLKMMRNTRPFDARHAARATGQRVSTASH